MPTWTYDSASVSDTDRLGGWLADSLPDTAVVALIGTLGAGKTHLVRAIAQAAGVDPRTVVSPTFVLLQQYRGHGNRAIAHFDAYRLRDDDEFLQLGPEEYFERPGWSFVEWAERVAACLPEDALRIAIESTGASQRRFCLSSDAPRFGDCLDRLRRLAEQHGTSKG